MVKDKRQGLMYKVRRKKKKRRWDKCEDAFFSANECCRERGRERKRKGKEKGKGELEVKLWQKRKKFANAPAGNRRKMSSHMRKWPS